MYMLRMLPQSRVWWMGHRALRALVLLKHFACSLAVQQRLSRAPCSLWLSSSVPVTAAGVRLELRVGNSTLLWGCVLPSTDLLGVGSCAPSQPSNPPAPR